MNSGWPSQRFMRGAPLDLLHHGCVVPDAGVEAEVATVHLAEADRFDVASSDAGGQQLHGGDRVVGHAQRSGEHVGAAAGKHPQCCVGAGDPGGHFVERAVAAVADDHVDTSPRRILSEAGGVTATVRLDDLDGVAACRQGAVNDDRVARRHRRRERVHHEQDAHRSDGTG
jgi:hypothetical protein